MPRYTPPCRSGIVLRALRDLRTGRQVDVPARPERALRPSATTVLAILRRIADELGIASPWPHPHRRPGLDCPRSRDPSACSVSHYGHCWLVLVMHGGLKVSGLFS